MDFYILKYFFGSQKATFRRNLSKPKWDFDQLPGQNYFKNWYFIKFLENLLTNVTAGALILYRMKKIFLGTRITW